MAVRGADKINADLGNDALPLGFVSIPIYSRLSYTMADNLEYAGCSFVNAVDSYRFTHDSTYENY